MGRRAGRRDLVQEGRAALPPAAPAAQGYTDWSLHWREHRSVTVERRSADRSGPRTGPIQIRKHRSVTVERRSADRSGPRTGPIQIRSGTLIWKETRTGPIRAHRPMVWHGAGPAARAGQSCAQSRGTSQAHSWVKELGDEPSNRGVWAAALCGALAAASGRVRRVALAAWGRTADGAATVLGGLLGQVSFQIRVVHRGDRAEIERRSSGDRAEQLRSMCQAR